jgi:iron complex outermembrane receptor protein
MWLNNPGLEPETSTSYEVGVKFRSLAKTIEGSAALYQTTFKDKIAVATVGAQRQFQNLGETRVYGLELDLRAHLGEYWQPFFNYTYTDSEITENPSDTSLEGNETANTPRHKANIGLLYDNPGWMTAQVTGRYVGKRFYQDSNADNSKVKDHFLVDVKLSKSFSSGSGSEWTASLSVDNLFDENAYGFWYEKLDGRNYWLELGVKF